VDHDSCSRCSHLLPEHAHLCFEELIFISPARNSEFSQFSLFSYFFDFSHVRQVFFHCITVQVEAASTGFKAFLHSKVFKDPNLQLFPKSFPSRAARNAMPMLCQFAASRWNLGSKRTTDSLLCRGFCLAEATPFHPFLISLIGWDCCLKYLEIV
jgi:hypothetical protein